MSQETVEDKKKYKKLLKDNEKENQKNNDNKDVVKTQLKRKRKALRSLRLWAVIKKLTECMGPTDLHTHIRTLYTYL